jgi:hypothetical protein
MWRMSMSQDFANRNLAQAYSHEIIIGGVFFRMALCSKMDAMKRHFLLLLPAAILVLSVIGLVLILNLTNPLSAGPFGILVMFGLVYSVSFSLLLLLIRLLEIIYRAIRPLSDNVGNREKTTTTRKRLTLAVACLSFVPIFIISLNSIGQLNFWDVVLIVAIETLAIFYISRRI